MPKSKIVIVGAEVVGKMKGADIYKVQHSTAYTITVDKVPFDKKGKVALVPGRDGNSDTFIGTPQEDGGNPQKGTAPIEGVSFRDFQGNDVYTATVFASIFSTTDNKDFEEVGMVFAEVHDLIPE